MKKRHIFIFLLISLNTFAQSKLINDSIGSISKTEDIKIKENTTEDTILLAKKERIKLLNESSPMDFVFNEITQKYIEKYLKKENKLIPKMISISEYYFPMIEQQLDKFQIPLELKYIAVVESSLNPTSISKSGATGLWQFMYPTAKQYGLNITSYIDERQDPLKSTIAACQYFEDLYNIFSDWNLVLAAYNAGPGYLQRIMEKKEITDFWSLRPYLKKETQGYIPAFIAICYAMTYYKHYNIHPYPLNMDIKNTDTISFKKQVSYSLISERFCVSKETIIYLNPSFKRKIIPEGDVIRLPFEIIKDIVKNEDYFYQYIERVEKKEILVNEIRKIYVVKKGDCLSKIAREYQVTVSNIKEWNNLKSDFLSIADKLILYISEDEE